MSIWEKQNFVDKLFRQRMKDFSLENPDHLWEGIEKRLNAQSSGRYVWFRPLLNNFALLLSVVATTAAGAYIYQQFSLRESIPLEGIQLKAEYSPDQKIASIEKDVNQYSTTTLVDTKTIQSISNNKSLKGKANKDHISSTDSEKEKRNSLIAYTTHQANNLSQQETTSAASISNIDSELETLSKINGENSGLLTNRVNDQRMDKEEAVLFEPIQTKLIFVKGEPISWKNNETDGCAIKRPERIKYYIDAYYEPEVSQKSIKPLDDKDLAYAAERANSERFIMANSFGIRGSVVLPSGLAFRTGLNYSSTEERFDFVKERQEIIKVIKDPNNVPIDTITESIVIIDKIYNHYKFYDVPLIIGYEINLKDFVLTLNGGLGLNLGATQKGKIYSPDVKSTYDLAGSHDGSYNVFKSNAGLSLIASFGLNYKISNKWSILAEPSIRYYIKSLSDPSYPLSQRFNSFGLQAGVRYRIL